MHHSSVTTNLMILVHLELMDLTWEEEELWIESLPPIKKYWLNWWYIKNIFCFPSLHHFLSLFFKVTEDTGLLKKAIIWHFELLLHGSYLDSSN